MPVFKLKSKTIAFPPAEFADSEGLLAEGGDLTAQWLLEGYKSGFYLWSNPMENLKWWTPNPRIIMFPKDLNIPEIVKQGITNKNFTISFNQDLEELMKLIQSIENTGTMNKAWLTARFMNEFLDIEKMGYTFSVEVYQSGKLVGGAFGATNKKVVIVEYINGIVEYAREYALIELVKKMDADNYKMIDLQKETTETIDIGLSEISRSEYLNILKQ